MAYESSAPKPTKHTARVAAKATGRRLNTSPPVQAALQHCRSSFFQKLLNTCYLPYVMPSYIAFAEEGTVTFACDGSVCNKRVMAPAKNRNRWPGFGRISHQRDAFHVRSSACRHTDFLVVLITRKRYSSPHNAARVTVQVKIRLLVRS